MSQHKMKSRCQSIVVLSSSLYACEISFDIITNCLKYNEDGRKSPEKGTQTECNIYLIVKSNSSNLHKPANANTGI